MSDLVARGANPQTIRTLREIHEGCKTRHYASLSASINGHPCCQFCTKLHPCPDYVDAVAALELLDKAAKKHNWDHSEQWRLVPDPAPLRSGDAE